RLKREKDVLLMAHYYQPEEIQELADVIGDSLALARRAVSSKERIIVICGVYFMGETAKILNPTKKVLVPDVSAGCSLADGCLAKDLMKMKEKNPEYKVVSYVNTSAEVKMLSDIVVTSSNALQIVNSFPKEEKIIFVPDRNLGGYINAKTGRDMLLWEGACHVHNRFSLKKMLRLKEEYPDAEILAHPECKKEILDYADRVGSTADLLSYAQRKETTTFLVATEWGISYEMKKKCPDKMFIPIPPEEEGCRENLCEFMRKNTLEKLYDCLLNEVPEVSLPMEVIKKAVLPIEKMLQLSK
ncbi:MAG TPA: quinolinate synthase, partial [Porphyromonadaceae bacterium]|nr:quinolinate synthase [Porphyromonadaceae bacterium]